MPLYDFECPKCGWEGTLLSSIEMSDKKSCPECEQALKKKVSAPSTFKFNGVKATASM